MPRNRAIVRGTLPTEQPVICLGLLAEQTDGWDPLAVPDPPTFKEMNAHVGTISGNPDCHGTID